MFTNKTDVLIVGAGPTGLALANVLARHGIACRILQAETEFHHHSRGKGLQPRSLEILDNLGVVDELLRYGVTEFDLVVHNRDRQVAELAIKNPGQQPGVPYPGMLVLSQWHIETILRARLAEQGVTVELDSRLSSFADDGCLVTALVSHSATGRQETITADYLVGCDGGHSTVRHQLGLTLKGETREQHFLLADMHVDGLAPDRAHVWFNDDKTYLALAPMPSEPDIWQCQASITPDGNGQVPPATEALFQALIDERTGGTSIRVSRPTWLSGYHVNQRMVEHYRVGRVFLAGDAAHVHSPAGGQGMNTGIQDAYNLGWKLAFVLQGKGGQALLDTYQEERLPVARSVLAESGAGTSALFSSNPLIALARDYVLVPLMKQPAFSAMLMRKLAQLNVNYRGTSLALNEGPARAHAPQAGDRAPDARLQSAAGAPVRLFDQFRGPHFTALIFAEAAEAGRAAEPAAQLAAALGDDVRVCLITRGPAPADWPGTVLLDADGEARQVYGARGATLCLIRPDGYIGLRAEPIRAAALQEYVGQFAQQHERQLA